jgi:hypothetical protein
MVNLDAYPDDVIVQAFLLHFHIKRHGLDAIHFSDAAREAVRSDGPDIIAREIRKELSKI